LTELDVMRTETDRSARAAQDVDMGREPTSVARGSLDADAGMCAPLTAGDRKYWGRTYPS
jgi:hypothetical protein